MKKISNHHYPEKCKGLLILSVYFMLSYYMYIYIFFFIFHYYTPCSIEGWLLPGTARYLFFNGNSASRGFFRAFSQARKFLYAYIGPWGSSGVERVNCMSISPAKR